MAGEEVVVAAETTTSVSNSDNHKRKLEDSEQAVPGESVLKGEAVPDLAENPKAEVKEGEKDEKEDHVDGSEAKRPRLEEKVDDIGAENGHREEKKREESKEDDTVEKPPCLDNNIQLDNGPEVDDIHTEEKKGDESEVDNSGEKPASLDHCRQLDNGPKVDNESPETTISTQPVPIDDLETSDVQESNNNDKLQKYYNSEEPCKGEDHEPSYSLPRQADAPNDQDKNITLETQTISRILEVPNNKVGVLIGKGGETIRHLQTNSGAKIQITRDSDSDPHSTTRPVELIGTLDSVVKAEKLIKDVIAEADAGGSPSLVAKGFNPVQSVVGDQIEMKVPIEKVGLVIGKGGETIKDLQARSGARIQLVQLSDGEQVKERTVRVTGERKQIERAREMIQEVMDQRVRASPVSMGYSQQTFHPCGPVAPQWGPPPYGPVQNPCYDFRQRGPYPSPSPQQHPAPVYGSYPSHQPPLRSWFGPSWEQRLPSPMQQGPPPPPSQANYNYGQPQPLYQQHQPQPHGQNYGHPGQMPPPMIPQQMAAYPPQGGFTGDPYGKPPSYGLMMQQQAQASHVQQQHHNQQPQASHVQHQQYSQQPPRGVSQSAEVLPTYSQLPHYMASAHGYGTNMQQYPYPSTGGPMQQTYPAGTPCGPAAPSGDGYSQHPQQPATGPVYPQQQPPAAYAATQTGQQPPAATTHGSSYPSQPPADNSTAGYGYQAQPPPADPYGGSSIPHQSTAATYNAQPCYAQFQPPATPTGYDQSVAQSGGYVVTQPTTQAAAATSYGSSV